MEMESISDLGGVRPGIEGMCVYWSKQQMNKYANTTTLKKEVDKGGLILTEPMEMGRYIGDVVGR